MASNAIKRQRHRRRQDSDGDPEFQVAPMVDVLLVLMLFFMAITSTEILKKDKNLHLPDATNAKPAEKGDHKNQVVVNVGWVGHAATFVIDQIQYPDADSLVAVLAQKIHQNPRAYVLIRADQEVEYSNISDVMTSCASAGVATVSFAAIKDPGKAGHSDTH